MERFSAVPLGVLFPVNMGNRGQNMLPVDETFRRLRVASSHVRFVAYHPRISGNFVFENVDRKAIQEAVTIGTRITGLTCLARSFDDLATADRAVPLAAEVIRDSVVLQTLSGVRRIVFVTLSDGIGVHSRFVGILGKRIEALSWSSDRDVLCHYERPGEQGDVGQVTRALVNRLRKLTGSSVLVGTGRAMMVIRDLLSGRRVKSF